jgi:23S rRNA (cytosine1962-C5)-methyltransferase
MIGIAELLEIIEGNSLALDEEFKRVFHGRGNYYEGWESLTIDSIDTILSIAFYSQIDEVLENELLEKLKKLIKNTRHETIILQRRYLHNSTPQIIYGELKKENYALENDIKIKLNLFSNQNNGYFPDMKNGREYIKSISKDKNVLNLFSYTCAFSLAASMGGAKSVTNVDMSKGALSVGRENHHLNDISTKNINFMPYNILKSFSRIKKNSPYDIIIIDPPSFQKGSFEATKDYEKIIKKLDLLASEDCTILSCLNSPFLGSEFIIEKFKEYAPSFKFIKKLDNPKEFISIDYEKSLKNLIFQKK